MDIKKYWQAVLKQQADEIRIFFHKEAVINWHNTNERFTVAEFITANCEYPGSWDGKLERMEEKDDITVTVVHVFSQDNKQSFHVTSFIKIKEEKIMAIDEYWGDDGTAPQWRVNKHIGVPIHGN